MAGPYGATVKVESCPQPMTVEDLVSSIEHLNSQMVKKRPKGKRPMNILTQATYKPGDQAPEGYLAWHEWADTQHKAGLRQKECGRCGNWFYPQQLSDAVDKREMQTKGGRAVTLVTAVCNVCDSSN